MYYNRMRARLKAVVVCGLLYGALFTGLRYLQYRSFFSFEWGDDAAENQVVFNIADRLEPVQTVLGPRRWNLFSDHFTPIDFLAAVPYALFPSIMTWHAMTSFAFGLSAVALFLLGERVLKDERSAFLVALAYLLCPALHFVNLAGFDPRTFSLPFLFLALLFAEKKKLAPFLACVVLVCLCKEDLPLIGLALALWLRIKKYPRRWWLTTLAFSAAYFALAFFVSNRLCRFPDQTSRPDLGKFTYLDLPTLKALASFAFTRTGEAAAFVLSRSKFRAAALVLAPLLFLPLLSWEVLLPATMAAEIALSRPEFFNQNSDYLAPILPFVFLALLSTLRKVGDRRGKKSVPRLALATACACFLGNFARTLPGLAGAERGYMTDDESARFDRRFLKTTSIFDPLLYTQDPQDKVAWQMIDLIPPDAPVVASGPFLPALSSRRDILEIDLDRDDPARNAAFVLLDKLCAANGLGGRNNCYSGKEIDEAVRGLTDSARFVVVRREGPLVLLMRTEVAGKS